ncbi:MULTISPECIES: hypothetical protein [Kitasatospora]|uniref:Uncharacterized protein n=1 Tax=Kitasatospora cystarginea TaxID=58350 RepID=A0ABN3EQB5_9ACTN
MTDPEHPCRPSATRADWALVHPMLTVLNQAGIPIRSGDLDQLKLAAGLGPEFAQAFTRWIREAHATAAAAPVPAAPARPVHAVVPSPVAELPVPARPRRAQERHAS